MRETGFMFMLLLSLLFEFYFVPVERSKIGLRQSAND